jgi:hypothetical protein
MESNFKPKPILNRNELKQIKQSRTRVEGKKVITDDVRKLKSLKVTPDLAPDEQVNYYKSLFGLNTIFRKSLGSLLKQSSCIYL